MRVKLSGVFIICSTRCLKASLEPRAAQALHATRQIMGYLSLRATSMSRAPFIAPPKRIPAKKRLKSGLALT